MTDAIERVTVLSGHTSFATAYETSQTVTGGKERKTRHFLEIGTKGQYEGHTRYVTQTTDPRRVGDAWGRPNKSRYQAIGVLYLDDQGNVRWWGTQVHIYPAVHERIRFMGIYDQLNDRDRRWYDAYRVITQRTSPTLWAQWEHKITALVWFLRTYADRHPGANGIFRDIHGKDIYIGSDNVAAALAVARERIAAEDAASVDA